MPDSANETLTPEKSSTAAGLLTGVSSKISNLFNSAKTSLSGARVAGTSSSSGTSSILTNPLLWVAVVVVAGVVYFKKFRKPGRKAVKWRK